MHPLHNESNMLDLSFLFNSYNYTFDNTKNIVFSEDESIFISARGLGFRV